MNYYLYNVLTLITRERKFRGWGRKRTGRFAQWMHQQFGGTVTLLEDGFIRSKGLGVDGSPSFSFVEDDVGIYYDATVPSRLENILNNCDFINDTQLMEASKYAISFMLEHHISKYNNAPLVNESFMQKYDLCKGRNVLIIVQTEGDASLKYGMLETYTTDEIIDIALSENPKGKVYLKIHPDVLSGKKRSDISIEVARQKYTIIDEKVNPISLLKHFNKVYTKTSGMGFEALLCGCECVCFGMPFYAGWGITDDRSHCARRKRQLSIEEIFAAAYILYPRYYNPYAKKESDIFDTMQTIVTMRNR